MNGHGPADSGAIQLRPSGVAASLLSAPAQREKRHGTDRRTEIAARSGAPRQLVVFLHGYGADGNDLIGIGRQWSEFLPDAVFVSPHAPEPCGGAPMGRQWFGLTFRDPGERWRGVVQAGPRSTPSLTRAGASRSRRGQAGARRLQPGHDDGAARGPPPQEFSRRHRRLFWHARRRGASAGRGHRSPARASCMATRTRSFRCRRCSMRRKACPRPGSRSNGT